MNLTGTRSSPRARFHGLADDLVPDEELFDTALAWARKLAGQESAFAVEQIKAVSSKDDLDEGIEAEKQGFATAFLSEDGKEGISAFLQAFPEVEREAGSAGDGVCSKRLAGVGKAIFREPSSHDSVAVHLCARCTALS